MKEQLLRELLITSSTILGEESANKLSMAFSCILYKYHVDGEETKIINYDDSNINVIKNYIGILRLEGKSEQTIDQYERIITNFLQAVGKPCTRIITNDVRYYLSTYLTKRHVSNTTLDNQRRVISAFFSWLCTEEYMDKNPTLRIKKIKSDEKIRKPFSDIELEKIRQNTKTIKEKAIIEFLLSTGCRVSEVSNLHIQDIDFHKSEVIVYGKGSKERKVYISDKAMYYLTEYLNSRKDNMTYLFLNRNKQKMTKQNIEVLLKKIGKRANVNNVHPHRFRRTFATNAIKRGVPIQYIQKVLGHSSLDTTMIYCNCDDECIKAELRKIA